MMKLKDIPSAPTPQTLLYLGLGFGCFLLAYVFAQMGFVIGLLFSLLPIVIYGILFVTKYPYWILIFFFVANYFVMGLGRYTTVIPGGVLLDILIAFCFIVLFIRSAYHKVEWSRAYTGFTIASLIWVIYCVIELANPMCSPIAWMKSVRSIAFYSLFIAILTPIVFCQFKDLKRILAIYSVLTLIAATKAFIQKAYGFDSFETRWLYEDGGMSTHIIHSGIRYFSIYTDAGNFGAGMGFAMVVLSIAALYFKNRWIKFYYLVVAAAACYAMVISGTRGALAVPFAGYALYIILTKRTSIRITGLVVLSSVFIFLNFTNIGHKNASIRRMRSAFNTEDASLNVRLMNQQKIKAIMVNLPLGSGLGMGGEKAKQYAPSAPLSQIATDSWYVMIWVETGIVGLILHVSILLYLLVYSSYTVLTKLKNFQLKGLSLALIAGIFGVMVASYGNEIWGQLPTGPIIYTFFAFLFMGKQYDKEIAEHELHQPSKSHG